jgi:hypothetical protein
VANGGCETPEECKQLLDCLKNSSVPGMITLAIANQSQALVNQATTNVTFKASPCVTIDQLNTQVAALLDQIDSRICDIIRI